MVYEIRYDTEEFCGMRHLSNRKLVEADDEQSAVAKFWLTLDGNDAYAYTRQVHIRYCNKLIDDHKGEP